MFHLNSCLLFCLFLSWFCCRYFILLECFFIVWLGFSYSCCHRSVRFNYEKQSRTYILYIPCTCILPQTILYILSIFGFLLRLIMSTFFCEWNKITFFARRKIPFKQYSMPCIIIIGVSFFYLWSLLLRWHFLCMRTNGYCLFFAIVSLKFYYNLLFVTPFSQFSPNLVIVVKCLRWSLAYLFEGIFQLNVIIDPEI